MRVLYFLHSTQSLLFTFLLYSHSKVKCYLIVVLNFKTRYWAIVAKTALCYPETMTPKEERIEQTLQSIRIGIHHLDMALKYRTQKPKYVHRIKHNYGTFKMFFIKLKCIILIIKNWDYDIVSTFLPYFSSPNPLINPSLLFQLHPSSSTVIAWICIHTYVHTCVIEIHCFKEQLSMFLSWK